jgi:hypothetical protein
MNRLNEIPVVAAIVRAYCYFALAVLLPETGFYQSDFRIRLRQREV